MKKKQVVAIGMSLILAFAQSGFVKAEETEECVSLEENVLPEECESIEENAVIEEVIVDADDINYGYIADDFEAPHLSISADGDVVYAANIYPEKYNGYELNLLPDKVRNQGEEGTCWAHSALGCVETDLIVNHDADTSIDFSELQLAYFLAHDYNDPKNCHNGDTVSYVATDGSKYLGNGGNANYAYHAMINKVGPVEEQNVPYALGNTYSVPERYAQGYDCAQIKSVQIIPTDDRDGIKKAVMEHGAVSISYYASAVSSRVNLTASGTTTTYHTYVRMPKTNVSTYYCTVPKTNHAVMVVGWDDTMPSNYFGKEGDAPEGNGAWLVRNSWGGQGYGSTGYFWLSYYDVSLLTSGNAYAYDASFETDDNVYSYEGISIGHSYYYNESRKLIGAQQDYRINGGECITSVGFETRNTQLIATAYVSDGKRTVSGSVETLYAGFYTIELDEELYIAEDTTVTVKIIYEKPDGGDITILVEGTSDGKPAMLGDSKHHMEVYNKHEATGSMLLYGDGRNSYINDDICMMVYTNNSDKKFCVEYVNLEVAGSIEVNLYTAQYGYSDEELEGIYALVECMGEDYTVKLDDITCSIGEYSDKVYYELGNYIAAKDMQQKMTIHLYDVNDELIPISNSNTDDGVGYECSIYDYIKVAQQGSITKLKDLTGAMAAYGIMASCYFGEETPEEAVEEIVELLGIDYYNQMITSVPNLEEYITEDFMKREAGEAPGLKYIGTSLLLESNTGIRHYFVIEEGYSVDDFTFEINERICSLNEINGIYYIEISDITALNYKKASLVSVNSGEYQLYYSVFSYFYDVMNNDIAKENEKLINLMKFMAIYNEKSREYVFG